MAHNGGIAQLLGDEGSPHIDFELLAATPLDVKRRMCALKKLQLKTANVEVEFYKRVHELEKEFEKQFGEINSERRKIVTGEREPADEECDIPLIHNATEEDIEKINKNSPETAVEKGIPLFWLHALQNNQLTGEMIEEHDEDILKYLIDISSTCEISPPGFTLKFTFDKNPYFTNEVLSKRYFFKMEVDEEQPFIFDGPSITHCEGTVINWNENKDVTKKVVKKKMKKGPNAGKMLTKKVKADSFFNFFEPPEMNPDKRNEDDDDVRLEDVNLAEADFHIGQYIHDSVIPYAILLVTGEHVDDDYYDEDDMDDEDDEMEDDSEDE